MKKVIRHKVTRAFFLEGKWTADFSAAQKFDDVLSILEARDRYQITEAEVVLLMRLKPTQYDVALPLSPGAGRDDLESAA